VHPYLPLVQSDVASGVHTSLPLATETLGASSGTRPDKGATRTVWGMLHAKTSLINYVANNSSEASPHGCLKVGRLIDSGARSGSESIRPDNCKAVYHGGGRQHAHGDIIDPRGITGNGKCDIERGRENTHPHKRPRYNSYIYSNNTCLSYVSTVPISPEPITQPPKILQVNPHNQACGQSVLPIPPNPPKANDGPQPDSYLVGQGCSTLPLTARPRSSPETQEPQNPYPHNPHKQHTAGCSQNPQNPITAHIHGADSYI